LLGFFVGFDAIKSQTIAGFRIHLF